MDFLKLVGELGFPIAAALAAGYFVFLTGWRYQFCERNGRNHQGIGFSS